MFEENIALKETVFKLLHAFLINTKASNCWVKTMLKWKVQTWTFFHFLKFTSLSKNSDGTMKTWIKMAKLYYGWCHKNESRIWPLKTLNYFILKMSYVLCLMIARIITKLSNKFLQKTCLICTGIKNHDVVFLNDFLLFITLFLTLSYPRAFSKGYFSNARSTWFCWG